MGISIPQITAPMVEASGIEDKEIIDKKGEAFTINGNIKVKRLKIHNNSNKIYINGSIVAEEIEITSNNGSVEIEGKITASKGIKTHGNSGSIHIKGGMSAGECIEIQGNRNAVFGSKEIDNSNSGAGSISFEFVKYE